MRRSLGSVFWHACDVEHHSQRRGLLVRCLRDVFFGHNPIGLLIECAGDAPWLHDIHSSSQAKVLPLLREHIVHLTHVLAWRSLSSSLPAAWPAPAVCQWVLRRASEFASAHPRKS